MAPSQPAPSQDSRVPQPAEGVHVSRPQEATAQTVPAQPVAAETTATTQSSRLVLPMQVVSKADISRALRELDVLDDYFHQAAIRGSKDQDLPKISQALETLATANNLNMIHTDHRAELKPFLSQLKTQAPVIHLSLPSEPAPQFIGRILEWFRTNVHPYALLHVGMQPELAAGCVVRTTNKMFDFSFRKRFEQSKVKLLDAIDALDKAAEKTVIADANATVAPENRLSSEQLTPEASQAPQETAV